jgi:uncharacterized protein (DUF952 family)
MTLIYKILGAEAWQNAVENGVFAGSAVDLSDGFMHFSDATQVIETAARHFAGQSGLVLVAIDSADLGEALRWEASRGGALFPHLYGVLDPKLARSVVALPWDCDVYQFPVGWDG